MNSDVQNPQETTQQPSQQPSQLLTRDQAIEYVLKNDPRFEVTEADIRGVTYRVFKNTPPTLRSLLQSVEPAYRAQGQDLLVYQDERWDYARFCDETNRIANSLIENLHVKQGDRVAVAMRNFPELPILIMAIASIGAVVVPMNAWWTTEELKFAIEDSESKIIFADSQRYQRIEPLVEENNLTLVAVRDQEGPLNYSDLVKNASSNHWPTADIDTDDDFCVLYSSGSTGHPKGVVLTHRGAIAAAYSWVFGRVMGPLMEEPAAPPPAPSWLIMTPLFHVTALQANFLHGLVLGAKILLMYKWDPKAAVKLIKKEQVTRVSGVPTQSVELMEAAKEAGETLDTLAAIASGGAKRPAAQVSQLANSFPNAKISSGWGMTETNALGLSIIGQAYVDNPEAAGHVIPPLQEIRILDDQDNEVPIGSVGELVIKGPNNMRCYLNRPEATAEAVQDGWLRTGDLVKQDEEGVVYIVDRKKSIIIRGGENISCLEVEGALYQHPDIAEACVFSVPDERLGEIVGVVIQAKPKAKLSEKQLKEFLIQHLATFKIPEKFWFWSELLPRGATDKIDQKLLRKKCLDSAGIVS